MSKRPRRNHKPAFNANVALAAVSGEKTLAKLAQHRTLSIEGGDGCWTVRRTCTERPRHSWSLPSVSRCCTRRPAS